jgi:hypothetical protein
VAVAAVGMMWHAALPGVIRERVIARTRSVLRSDSGRLS